jgi:hypothetical protein
MTDSSDIDVCLFCRGSGWRYVTQRAGLLLHGLSGEAARFPTRRPCRVCGGTGHRSSSTGTGAGAEPRGGLVTACGEDSARLGATQHAAPGRVMRQRSADLLR